MSGELLWEINNELETQSEGEENNAGMTQRKLLLANV